MPIGGVRAEQWSKPMPIEGMRAVQVMCHGAVDRTLFGRVVDEALWFGAWRELERERRAGRYEIGVVTDVRQGFPAVVNNP